MAQVDSFYHIFHRTNNPGMILQGHHWDFFWGPYPLYHSNSEIPPNPPVMTPYYRYVVTPQKVEQVINTISSRIYSTRNLRFCLFGVCSYISYINIYHILLCSVCFFVSSYCCIILPIYYLVGGLEHVVSIQLGMSWSQLTNSIIVQRGRLKPPTSYYTMIYYDHYGLYLIKPWFPIVISSNDV